MCVCASSASLCVHECVCMCAHASALTGWRHVVFHSPARCSNGLQQTVQEGVDVIYLRVCWWLLLAASCVMIAAACCRCSCFTFGDGERCSEPVVTRAAAGAANLAEQMFCLHPACTSTGAAVRHWLSERAADVSVPLVCFQ